MPIKIMFVDKTLFSKVSWIFPTEGFYLTIQIATLPNALIFRWVKFEEDVEEGGNRWSKPHVATLSLHSLFELRSMLLNGTICLDMSAYCLEDICDLALDTMVNSNQLPFEKKSCVKVCRCFNTYKMAIN